MKIKVIIAAFAIVALQVVAGLATDGGDASPHRWWVRDAADTALLPDVAAAARSSDLWKPTGLVSAPTIAVTEPQLSMTGSRPFGIPLQLILDTDPGASFTISFDHAGGDVVWTTRDGVPVLYQHRGWMNLGYVWNQGEAPDFPRAVDQDLDAVTLNEWMERGCLIPLYADCEWGDGCYYGDYIPAKPGTNATALCAAPPGTIHIPIYDAALYCATEIPVPRPPCPTDGGGFCYHVVGFAGIEITDCSYGEGRITAQWVTAHRPGTSYLRKYVAPSTAEPGQAITYTLVYTNYGPETLSDVLVTDSLPITLTNLSYTYSGARITATGSFSYTWQVEELDVGEGGIITVTAEITPGAPVGILTNMATITATGMITTFSNTDYATVAVSHVPGVTLGPDHTASADSESVVAYTHILTNTGNGSDVFDLAHRSSQDWSVAYETPLSVGRGQTATVVVSITVPVGSGGLTDVTTITATSQADAGVWATTTDTTIVAALTPGAPTLLAPPDGTVTTTQAITFTWAPTTTGAPPTGYNLKLDDATIITTTIMTWSTNLSTGVHTWTVRAYNDSGYLAWAFPWQVEIVQHHVYLPLVLRNYQ